MRRNIFIMSRLALVLIFNSFLLSCVTTYVKGSRIDEVVVKKIEVGKTNRSDILKMFGAPDRIIDEGGVVASKSVVAGDIDIASKQEMTVGKNQEIYIYEYVEAKNIDYYFGTGALGGKVEVKKNTLMIWIDKDTGKVQDYGYKKEIE